MSAFDDEQLLDEDEEMPLTERDLADDAQWKIIQKNTFTRWANEHLKTINKNIADLETDFGDGLRLIGLVEVLSGKKFRKTNKRPNFRTQKLENVTMVLKFLEEDEGIKIVNIDSGDIVDQKLKLILGLIWTLILHYSISMPMWEGEDPQPQEGAGPTPKQRLLNWINSKVPDLPIKNFTTDWNDGKAIGALVDAVAPGLCPDWEDWDPKKAKDNAKEAMDAAEKWLDVPQLIKPDEMTNPKVDDLSMMTYLSQFPQAKLKPGAPLRPKLSAGKVRAYGPGLEPKGNMVGSQAKFTVETFGAGKGKLELLVLDPKGKEVKCDSVFNKDTKMTYTCVYVPSVEGDFRVIIKYGEKEIAKSPFKVRVEGAAGDASKVTAKGPGLEKTGVTVNMKTYFEVFTKDAGKGAVDVTIMNPAGHKDKIKPTITTQKDGVYLVEYTATEIGLHSINVYFAGKPIPKSPFGVNVADAVNAKAAYATGRGIQPRGVRVKQHADFKVHTKGAGTAEVKCQVIGPGGVNIKCEVKPSKTEEGVYECFYIPPKVGQYVINITFGGQHITKSPFRVDVGPEKTSKIVAYGPGLEGGVVNQPACFTVETNGETGALGFSIEGPSQAKIDCKDNGDGSADVTYWPTAPGEYAVHIMCEEEDIPQAPYMAQIQPATTEFDASKVIAKGPGLEKTGVIINKWAEFTVDARKAGKAPLHVTCLDTTYKPVNVEVKDNKDGTFSCRYNPKNPVKHTIIITWGSVSIPKSPFRVNVTEPTKPGNVKVYGPGVEKGVKTFVKTHFKVDCKTAGPGDVAIALTDEKGKDVPVHTTDNKDSTFTVEYEPTSVGVYTVQVYFAEKEIPASPIKVKVESSIDVSKVTVKGLDTPIEVDEVRPIKVNTTAAGRPDAPCHVTTASPRGDVKELPIQKIPEGYQALFAPLEPGPHVVNVNFAGKDVPKSPFHVTVEPKVDSGAVDVLGLETPIKVGEPRPVTVMTSTTGRPDAPCKVEVTNPRGQTKELPTKKIPEGYIATLAPEEVGPHKVNVQFNNKEIPKSPFSVMAEPAIDFNKVTVSGLEEPVEVGEIRPVTVDTAKCGTVDAPCQITSTNPAGQVRELPLQKTPTGFQTQFAPLEEGPHLVAVKYAGKELPKSPYPVKAVPQGPPASKVKAYGPGLERGMATEPAKFTIDTRSVTQPGGLGVTVEGPTESKIECRDNQDGTCDVTYYPTAPGDYNINITYADEHIPKSPFQAKIAPSANIDVSGIKAYGPGLEPGVFLDSPTSFTVDAKSVTPVGEGKVRAIVTSPTGQRVESLVKNQEDGTYNVLYTPYEQGPNRIDVTYEDIPIPESPIEVTATPGCDASRVRAYGPGLEGGFTDTTQEFTVDVTNSGQGGLGLAIDGPAETQIQCKDNRDGTCKVEYVPVKPGDYDITIKFADQHIPGSPFHVGIKQPLNPAKVQCYGPGLDSRQVQAGRPATFTVDTTEAGEAPLDVTYTDSTGRTRPVELVPVTEGKFNATYKPDEEGKCKVDVKYAGQPVPNSPFNIEVQPGSKADKVKVPDWVGVKPILASIKETFTIDCREAGPEKPDVLIMRPDGTLIRPTVESNHDGTWKVEYTPEDVGPYAVNIKYENEPIPNLPLRAEAKPTGDASKCKITEGLDNRLIPVRKETVITVDASNAGTGQVTCRIRSKSGTELDIDITDNSDGTFTIVFTPSVEGDYSINIQFGGQPIPGGDYVVQAVDENDSQYQDFLRQKVGEDIITADTVDAVHAAQELYSPVAFNIKPGPVLSFVTAYITTPSGRTMYPKIEDNKDGSVTLKYQPKEVGLHALHVHYNKQEITGSPFQFHVDAVDSGYVTAFGPGLSHGVANEPAEFTIITKDAGAGGLQLAIEGPSKTEIQCKDNGDGTCTVSYLPTIPGEYKIVVKFADKDISGSPFCAKITPGEQRQRAQLGRSSEVSLKITETDITSLTAVIHSPSGKQEPCMLKRLPNGHLGISFTPREVGEHLVDVLRNGQHIENSPFKINVGESELGNARNVRAYGKGLEEGMANEVNEFVVDTREAGYGGLSLSIEGPSKADIECHDNEDGTCRVTYKPTEPGTYIINIKFADEHVPGSPFTVKIGGEPSERITERIMRHQQAVDVTHVGSQCELSLKIPGTSPFDMTASVTSPSGITELCDVVSLDDCHYSIKFVPNEMGKHTVSCKHKDMHIPGSPFQFTVGPIAEGGAHKVRAAGVGLEHGEVNEPAEFNIYTREAGAGGLSIAVEGPSKAEVDFEDRKDGSCGVNYIVSEPGEYTVSIKFNDDHIPDSPFRVPITPSIGEAKKLSVSALQNKGLQIGKPCAFVVNFNGAPRGKLQARVVSPSGAEEDALVQEIDEGEYAVRFIPRENGTHFVYVSFNGCQIPDSPFRIQVGTVHADPGMVQAYGDGLRTGKTGQPCKFIVNTVNAGAGALAVTVEGPSKVKLECKDVDDGYEFTYNPTAPGDYLINIRYAGTNIAGSPFKAKIEGTGKATGFQEQASVVVETVTKTSVMSKFASLPPFVSDASKVTCDGNGLKKGYRHKQCTFNVDTSNAGNNMLFIGMIGPKGPCEELCVKHIPGKPYKITYCVKESGDYMLIVKWGDEQIPGSPFCVKVD